MMCVVFKISIAYGLLFSFGQCVDFSKNLVSDSEKKDKISLSLNIYGIWYS